MTRKSNSIQLRTQIDFFKITFSQETPESMLGLHRQDGAYIETLSK